MGISFNVWKKYLSLLKQKMKELAFSLWAMPRQANLTMNKKKHRTRMINRRCVIVRKCFINLN